MLLSLTALEGLLDVGAAYYLALIPVTPTNIPRYDLKYPY